MRDIVVHLLYIVTCIYTWLILDTSVSLIVRFLNTYSSVMCFRIVCDLRRLSHHDART